MYTFMAKSPCLFSNSNTQSNIDYIIIRLKLIVSPQFWAIV